MMRNLIALALLAPAAAFAAEHQYQFRSIEDPSLLPDPAVCARAGFGVNLRLAGGLWTYETRGRDGEVRTDEGRRIGTATACARITSLLFPPGLQQEFYVELNLPDGPVAARGTCTIISNDMPMGTTPSGVTAGIVLAGCNLRVLSAPAGVLGGAVATLSTFNPYKVTGFGTGSMWTVQLYEDGTPGNGREDSDRAMEWISDE